MIILSWVVTVSYKKKVNLKGEDLGKLDIRSILPRQFLPNVKLVRHIPALFLPILYYSIQMKQKKKKKRKSEWRRC